MTVSMRPESIELLRAEAKRRSAAMGRTVSQGDVIESLLERIPDAVTPIEQPANPWQVEKLVSAIFDVQTALRGDVELGALDRNSRAPVQSWLLALRHDIDKALTVRGVGATVSMPQTAQGVGTITNPTERGT